MKKLLLILISVCVLCLSACSNSRNNTADISETIGIDLSSVAYATRIDTHRGFHGDGSTIVTMPVSGESVLAQIQGSADWHSLPLSENLTAVVYGTSSAGPYITVDDTGHPAVPEITNGYYFFLDRHRQSTDPHDDTNVLSRASFNLTIAIYDCDTATLYYLEFDT